VTATIAFMGDPIDYGSEQPGDLIMPDAGHVGMCAGNGQYWDAPHTGTVVQLQSYGKPYAIRRVATPSTGASGDAILTADTSTGASTASVWDSLSSSFSFIFSAQGWERIGEVVGGSILIGIGLWNLSKRL
jgi:hypothetical protein